MNLVKLKTGLGINLLMKKKYDAENDTPTAGQKLIRMATANEKSGSGKPAWNGKTEYIEEVIEEVIADDGSKTIKKTVTKKTTILKGYKGGATAPKLERNIDMPTIISVKDEALPSDFDREPDGFDLFETNSLNEHNALRDKHGSPPLVLSRDLCEFAKEWAEHLATAKNLNHRPNNKFGENIYWKSGTMRNTGEEPVQSWYAEIQDYHWFAQEPPKTALHATGHFTQVIWKNTEEMGIARIQSDDGLYVVANYKPHGNYITHYSENVLAISK